MRTSEASGRQFQGVLLVSDMDRTLIASDQQISQRNCLAVNTFIRQGGHFAIASGRAAGAVRPFLSRLTVNCPCILENGGLLYDLQQDAVIWKSPLSPEVVPVLQALAEAFPDIGIEAFTTHGIVVLKENRWTRWHTERDRQENLVLPAIAMTEEWFKLTLAYDPERMPQAIAWLSPRLGPMQSAFSEPYFYDLVNAGVTKGRCLSILAKHLGIAPTQTVAAGDYDNDVEMIQTAAYGFAVANATPSVMQAAAYRCSDCDHDAVADLIAQLPAVMKLSAE